MKVFIEKTGLNGNILKILACVFMLLDHIGFFLLKGQEWVFLRYIGRLAFPIFAFCIAEGCKYTRNKFRYFGFMFCLGFLMALVQFFATNVILGNVLITFSLSILTIYLLQYLKKQIFAARKKFENIFFVAVLFLLWLILLSFLTSVVSIEYSFFGILLPVFFSIFDTHKLNAPNVFKKMDNIFVEIFLGAICLVLISLFAELSFQWFSLFALIILLLYSGERGKFNLKYLFYVFYPVHILILYGLSLII